MALSQNALARALGVPPRRINEIVLGKRAVTADTALRLARALGTTEQFWMAYRWITILNRHALRRYAPWPKCDESQLSIPRIKA